MKTELADALPEKISRLGITSFKKEVGILAKNAHFSFRYINEAFPISLTMPYQDDSFNRGSLHPVFTQNLPEGYLRQYIAEKLRRYANIDDMYLLALMGDKGIGHLAYSSQINVPKPEPIKVDDILKWSGKDRLFPQLLERYYLSGMASGVQPKVILSRATVLQKDVIVKTYDEEFWLLTVNEFVCMKCAQYCGLNIPNVSLSDNLEHYIIERFDTDATGNKIGLEDFATLMGKTGDQKYQGSYENVLKATFLNTQSTVQVLETFKLIVFNCLIGNGDAHLKNFSLAYTDNLQDIGLSPAYDITHTLIYPTIDNDMALKMRKSRAFPSKAELVILGFNAGIARSIASNAVDKIASGIVACIQSLDEVNAMEGLEKSIIDHLKRTMEPIATRRVFVHDKKKKYP